MALLTAVGLVAWVLLDDPTYVAPTPPDSVPSAQPGEASAVLADLERAVDARDPAAAETLAAPGDAGSRALLGALVDNAQELRVEDFTLRYVDEIGAVSASGAWEGAVDVTWTFSRFDRAPARSEVGFRFRTVDGEVYLDSVGGGERRLPLWLSGDVEVRRSPGTLVLVDGSGAAADRYARLARAAVPVVREVLPSWRTGLVVEAPSSVTALHEALAADPGTYTGIAAVTTTTDGSLASDAPVHVFVNPAIFGQLRPTGSQVVMSHEAVHVATEAATNNTMPLWLLEGFADYVALLDVDLPVSTAAGQIIDRVREEGPPESLPGSVEFDTTTTHLGATYESAWLACRLLADRGGQAALVRLYMEVRDGTTIGSALQREFGLTEAELTQLWRDLLTDLAA
ncbi:MAG: hypothetical protein ACRDOX_02745 [Nocardioides sp.]